MNTLSDIEYQDARAELHRQPHPDVMGPAEELAEWEHELECLEAGGGNVPPWMTLDGCIAHTEETIGKLRDELDDA